MSIKIGQNAPEFTMQGVVGDKFKDVCLDEIQRQVGCAFLLSTGFYLYMSHRNH